MINITLRQLRYFDALARHGHFGRAAEACAISQPALSMQIKEMEETLGGLLAGRLRVGMIPTIAPYLLPTVIANLKRMHPGLDIHVREALTAKLLEEL